MKAIVCDKCKKVITDKEELKDTIRLDLRSDSLNKFSEKHICNDCNREFYNWFKNE